MPTIPSANVAYRTGNLMSIAVDAEALAAELRMNVHGEVRFDAGSRALYATDGSNYRQVPIGGVIPRTARGRARLLFEMLQGDVIGKDGWRDESVKEALDLCLACKGCKGECPVNVDMAT